ncbi:hypothetical protein [Streptomyces sp. NPDC047974]|uniref:hypothetical protein n=1 Tax=Streptomyces sp. NPDC047974 TaxID=3154343 RepID=UPI0033E599FA
MAGASNERHRGGAAASTKWDREVARRDALGLAEMMRAPVRTAERAFEFDREDGDELAVAAIVSLANDLLRLPSAYIELWQRYPTEHRQGYSPEC